MAKGKEIEESQSVEVISNCDIQPYAIENMILNARGKHVMLDRDLADLYGVSTKVLNQAVKRNIDRFPEHFRFQLDEIETTELVTNCDRLRILKHSSSYPFVFTEQGVAMLSTVLRSDRAIRVSIRIIDAFVAMRQFIGSHAQMFQRLEIMEQNQLAFAAHLSNTDNRLEELFKRLEDGSIRPTQGIFFDGQIFDAYAFVNDLIREAKKTIVLIDNYVDDQTATPHRVAVNLLSFAPNNLLHRGHIVEKNYAFSTLRFSTVSNTCICWMAIWLRRSRRSR